jgi:hypothetical protein
MNPVHFLDSLEPRNLFAAFASVGLVSQRELGFDPASGLVYATEGRITPDDLDDDGSRAHRLHRVSGSVFQHSDSDRSFVGDLWYRSVTSLDDGRFLRDPARGYWGSPRERNGSRFLAEDDYPAGWFFSDYGDGRQEIELLLQRPSFEPDEWDFEGNYRYNLIYYDRDDRDFSTAAGRLSIDDGDISYDPIVGRQPYTSSRITGVDDDGVLRTSRREYFYLSESEDTVIFADMARDDNVLTIGVATREDSPVRSSAMIGRFLMAYGSIDGDDLRLSQLVLDLESDGDYKFYDLDAFDDGKLVLLERGFWKIEGSSLVLDKDRSDDELRFTIGEDGTLLVGSRAYGKDSQSFFGIGTRVQERSLRGGDRSLINLPITGDGDLYQLEDDNTWYRTDLERQGTEPITGPIVSWVDPKDSRSYAAAVTDKGLALYAQDRDKRWSVRNLTSDVPGSSRITRDLAVMVGSDGKVHLSGFNAAGDLVRYHQTGGRLPGGRFDWAFENISLDALSRNNIATPGFTGLVSFATSWNALNICGLDRDGEIWAVWWAPGMSTWAVNNLTRAYGAEPLSGGLNVYLTPWNGINIGGIGTDGSLKYSWWVPEMGGTWAQSNLTSIVNGPRLQLNSVRSFVSSWGALNIAGIDRDTGDVKVYWWTPQRVSEGWAVANMAAALPPNTPKLTSLVQARAADDGSLNLLGSSGSNLFRYYWKSSLGGNWAGENVSAVVIIR